MGKYMNLPDLALIAVSAYGFVWGINYALRSFSRPNLQA
jgi:hypothetical protein